MSRFALRGARARDADDRPRVGLFGHLGSGNIGNDASLEAMLTYFSSEQPGTILDAMTLAPEAVKDRYGVPAVPLRWLPPDEGQGSGRAVARKSLVKVIDTVRIASWVRRHDVVMIPGMGVLETALPQRPWQGPYNMLVLCAAGRIFGTKVALVCVGANLPRERLTRWLFGAAGRLAFYRSYRDTLTRDAMRRMGVNTSGDNVYPDIAFGLPAPSAGPGDEQTVGIGLIDYRGTDGDDPAQGDEIRAAYVEKMKSFTRWLVDNGRRVRLFIGDTNNADEHVVTEILADIRAHRPDLDPDWVVAEPVTTFADLMRAMDPVSTVVATRYHNVICALMLAKPTISIGYGEKNAVLMAGTGLADYCQSIGSLDVDRLIEQFTDLESHAAQLRQTVAEGNREKAPLVERQRAELSAVLFQAPAPALAERGTPVS